ncbi:MAG: ABC transporter ATP-binding protein [Streptococcaceae bacterium]|jgi:branched-chain amino acid transport system ATP-binding protein|nr:ABC transporter ATP-binding protein [Streptococcaceae bacterium]
MALLEVKNLTRKFGGLTAVDDVSMEIGNSELIGLIGPNGAGKTTLFNLLTGVYTPTSGMVTLDGELLNGKKPYKFALAGLSRTFQNIRLFKDLSVLDNIKVAIDAGGSYGFFANILRLPSFYKREEAKQKEAVELLKLFEMEEFKDSLARNLPYGEQRRLEIIRALASKPKIVFLDEPAAGLNPQETAELTKLIRQIQQDFGISVVLIEHDMNLVMSVTERIYVLDYGKLLAEGTPEEIRHNEAVVKAYLGGT